MNLAELTKDELNKVNVKLFQRGLTGNKDRFVHELNRNLSNYGQEKYNDILINKILKNDLKESSEVIESDSVLAIKWLDSYEKFLYKYLLGYEKLYDDKSEKILTFKVDYGYIFDDQFNTEEKRICERDYFIIPSTGYEELTEARNNLLRCGYCGGTYTDKSLVYCNKCIGSEHLSEDHYHLLELKPISNQKRDKKELPQEMLTAILEAQKITKKAKAEKELIDNKERLAKGIKKLKRETEVKEYLLNDDDLLFLHGFYIYYTHSNTLSFKWNKDRQTPQIKELILKHKDRIKNALNVKIEY